MWQEFIFSELNNFDCLVITTHTLICARVVLKALCDHQLLFWSTLGRVIPSVYSSYIFLILSACLSCVPAGGAIILVVGFRVAWFL
ncbi:hypothetical protein Nepgr_024047 [Nepenthes gracilis]|uniref:Uncharacterized protein n=1 Tax=Nepenthes gracilis TaxID=150966 RepID=A0AAD3T464_NEPGR|nr:hypothetical protein Nepgr_024047 [Nepenthes gracilis]